VTVTNYPVVSTAIARVEYDDEEETVSVTFQKGGTYVLQGVPQIEVERWVNDGSPGGYWNSYMRGRY
jgi:hypothetical protein